MTVNVTQGRLNISIKVMLANSLLCYLYMGCSQGITRAMLPFKSNHFPHVAPPHKLVKPPLPAVSSLCHCTL